MTATDTPDTIPTATPTLTVDETSLELSVVPAVEGASGLSINSLLGTTGMVTYDPGFMNTAACRSAITYIDGDAGILRYRGYPIEQLAESSSYLETGYLLSHGELPTAEEALEWEDRILRHTHVHDDYQRLISSFPREAHPMAILSSAVAAMPGHYHEVFDITSAEQMDLATVLLLAKAPTLMAYALRHARHQDKPDVAPEIGYVADMLRLSVGPHRRWEPDPAMVRALDVLLLLHADHEQNCSTSTVRNVGSAGANLFLSVSAGISALAGPKHGGANEAVLAMLEEIRDSGVAVSEFMTKVKDKSSGARLMGFGHRVYKNYDPRAAIGKKLADEVLSSMGKRDELLDIAMELEGIALADDYFVERKLYPNVDFYTGLIYRAMGFPTSMFTPLFAIGRMPGWIAQWREMMQDPSTKIARPRQVYTGPLERDFVPVQDRPTR